MVVEVGVLTEGFGTLWAWIWLLMGMNPLMNSERVPGHKSFVARIASVRLDSLVNAHMLPEATRPAEAFRTQNTWIWFFSGVNPLVVREVACPAEALSTFITSKRFLTGVSAHVCEEVSLLPEAGRALGARIRLHLGVNAEVNFESNTVNEFRRTV